MGYDHNARAFEDLAEFVDHFFFLGSIHSFTPMLEGLPLPAQLCRNRLGPGLRVLFTGPSQSLLKGANALKDKLFISRLGQELWAWLIPNPPTVLDELRPERFSRTDREGANKSFSQESQPLKTMFRRRSAVAKLSLQARSGQGNPRPHQSETKPHSFGFLEKPINRNILPKACRRV